MELYRARVVFSKSEDIGSMLADNVDEAFDMAFEEWDSIRRRSTDYEDTVTETMLLTDSNGEIIERSAQ